MVRRLRTAPEWCDAVYDIGIVGFAAWTIAYHVCLVLRLGVIWAFAISAVVVVGWALLHRRLTDGVAGADPATPDQPGPESGLPLRALLREPSAIVTVLATVVAALAMAFDAPWVLVWTSWLLAAIAGSVTAWRHLRGSPVRAGEPPGRALGLVVVLGWALAMAVVSLWTNSSNGDDLFYVNLSQWVAAHGDFPIRDTLFANLDYPMANWPPMASYDGLVGATAWLFGLRAGTVVYLVVPPVAAFFTVLGLWRLLRAWQVTYVVIALSVTLLATGVGQSVLGEALVARLWQGKFLLAWILIPWLLVQLVHYVDRPSRRGALWLFTGGVAAVGLTTTGMFVVPVIALAGVAPLVRTDWRRAVVGFVATSAYPLAAGVVTKAVGGRSADLFDTRKLYRFDPDVIGHGIFDDGVIAVIGVLAVLLAALLVPHRGARLTTGLLAVVLGVILIPGVTHLAYDVIGLGPTLRRFRHGLVIAALVGVLVVRLGALVPGRRWLTVGGAAIAVSLVFAFVGAPVRTPVEVAWQRPFHWQRPDADRYVTSRLVSAGPLGGKVLAPSSLAVTIAVTTTSLKTVAPRAYYMDYLRDDPSFDYEDRSVLEGFVSKTGPWSPRRQPMLERALQQVNVAVACVYREATDRAQALVDAGMAPYLTTPEYLCFRR